MKVGPLLVVLGMVLMGISTLYPMATIIYASVYQTVPSGTISEPTPVVAGESFYPTIAMTSETKECIGLQLWGVDYDYEFYDMLCFNVKLADVYIYRGTKIWTVPTAPVGTIFEFRFLLEGKLIHTSYAEISEVTGHFLINSHNVNEETVLVVFGPELEITFIDTSTTEDAIKSVYVEITGEPLSIHLDQTADPRTWKCNYVLPDYGTYTIEGYFVPSLGERKRVMSIYTSWGQDGNGDGNGNGNGDTWTLPTVNRLTMIGLGLMVVGVVVSFMEKRR